MSERGQWARGWDRAMSVAVALGWTLAVAQGCGDSGGQPSADTAATDTVEVDTADAGPDPQCIGVRNGDPCDDGSPCTQNDKCIDEYCRGAAVSCDDQDPCTDDHCEVAAGCVHTPNEATCDDDNACTTSDRCSAGVCAGRPATNLACNDLDPCTLNDVCTNGTCGGKQNDCDDLNPCTLDSCDASDPNAESGTGCVHTPLTASCDDGNPCTAADACVEGVCTGTPNVGGACNDGNLCTTGETCQEDGTCGAGVTKVCADDNPCTQDLCDPQIGCRFPPDEGHACDDHDLCTIDDACDDDGICVGAPKDCQPADLCQVGTCEAATGSCVVAARNCNDTNPCTTDTCSAATGCAHTPNTASCDDYSLCTTGDHCEAGLCKGTPVVCDDSQDSTCQVNSCDPTTGQCGMEYFNGTLCNDGLKCTQSDVCASGHCVGVAVSCMDSDPCTLNYCDEATGTCDFDVLPEGECGDLSLERSNQYRAVLGLPLMVNHDAIIAAATAHCAYYVQNAAPYDGGLSPHEEEAGLPGFTGVSFADRLATANFDGLPMFEVMAFINDAVRSVDEWMATLYHRIPFIVPQTLQMGYGAAQDGARACDTIDFGENPATLPDWQERILPFPPDGFTGVPTSWDGAENPTPPLPAGAAYPSGPILTVTFTASSGYPGIAITDSVITDPDGNALDHVANSPETDAHLCCGVITLYPLEPLEPFTTYEVSVDYSRNGVPGTFTWSFTTGSGSSAYFLP